MSGASLKLDTRDFRQSLADAQVSITGLRRTATEMQRDLSRVANAFSGANTVRQAEQMAKAIAAAGGAGKLTAQELSRANVVLQEYAAKTKLIGGAAPEIKKLTDEITKLHAATSKGSSGGGLGASLLTGLGIGSGAAVGMAALQGIKSELGEITAQAARLGPVRQAFDRISGGADTANQQIQRMRIATRGMVDDLSLITAMNRGDILGLTGMGVDMAELAQVATTLGRAVGQDATKSVEDLTIALARQSPLILDNLGIKLSLTDAYQQYAAKIGVSVSKLSDEQKGLAFVVAGMDAAKKKHAELAGDLTATEQWTAVRTQLQGIATDFVSILASIKPVTDAVGELAGMLQMVRSAGIGASIRVGADNAVTAAETAYQSLPWLVKGSTPGLMLGMGIGSLRANTPRPSASDLSAVIRGANTTDIGGLPEQVAARMKAQQEEAAAAAAKAAAEAAKEAARKAAEASAKAYAAEIAKLTGTDLVANATKTAKQIEDIYRRGLSVAPTQVDGLVQQFRAAEQAATRLGKTIDQSVVRAIDKMTRSYEQATRAAGQALIDRALGGSLTASSRTLGARYDADAMLRGISGGQGGLIPSTNPLTTTYIQSAITGLTTTTKKWRVEVDGIADAFQQIAQISGDHGVINLVGGAVGGSSLGKSIASLYTTNDGKNTTTAMGIIGMLAAGAQAGAGYTGTSSGAAALQGSLSGGIGGALAGISIASMIGKGAAAGGFIGAGVGAVAGAGMALYSAQRNRKAQYDAKDAQMGQILNTQYGGSLDTLLGTVGAVGLNQESFLKGWFGNAKAFTQQTELLAAALAKEESAATKLGKSLTATAQTQAVMTREQAKALQSTRAGGPGAEQAAAFVAAQREAGAAGAVRAAQAIIARGTGDDGKLDPSRVVDFTAGGRASGAALLASVGAMQADGMLLSDILRGDVGTSLAGLQQLGVGGAGIGRLANMQAIVTGEQSGAHVAVAEGLGQALSGLTNSGQMTQDLFDALTAGITESQKALDALGHGGEQSFAVLHQPLQAIWAAQQQFGYEVDAATQSLLDQALAAGQIGTAFLPSEDRLLDAVNSIRDAFGEFLDGLPGAMAEAVRQMQGHLNTLHTPSLTMPGGGGDVDEFANGGFVDYPASGKLAMLHGREYIIPENRMRQILSSRITPPSIVTAGGGAQTIILQVDSRQLARVHAQAGQQFAQAYAR